MIMCQACAQLDEINVRTIDIRPKRILLSSQGTIKLIARQSIPAQQSILVSAFNK